MLQFTFVIINNNRSINIMAEEQKTEAPQQKVVIDNVEYNVSDLSQAAITYLNQLKFIEKRLLEINAEIAKLNSEAAVNQTAQASYGSALKEELSKINPQ